MSRRDANRAKTRETIVSAVFTLLQTLPMESVTADLVADLAGVSRRTFFNYFESVAAAVASSSEEILEEVRAALDARDPAEPLPDSARHVFEEIFTLERLSQSARVWTVINASPAATRYALEGSLVQTWELARAFADKRLERDGRPADPLRVAVLFSAFIAGFEAGYRDWLSRLEGEVTPEARADFLATVNRAIDYLAPAIDIDPSAP